MTTIKAGSAAGFLGLVPALLGYTPSESTVVVLFSGPRTVGCMRVDVPRQGDDLNEYASTLAGYACKKPDADGVAVIVYTQGRHDERALAILNAMLVRMNDCGMRIVDLLYVAGNGWGTLNEGGQPHPHSEIETHPDAPPVSAGDQHTSAQLPAVDETYAADVRARVREGAEAVAPDDGAQLLDLIERATTEAHPYPKDAATLAFIVERPALRDIALTQWTGGIAKGERALEAQLAWEEGTEYPKDLAMGMWGEGPQPDADRLARVGANLRELAAITNGPGAFATLAWVSWALGHATEADTFAKRALSQDSEHGLAQIVASFVNAGHVPEWAFHEKR